jgi:hypothetical protein
MIISRLIGLLLGKRDGEVERMHNRNAGAGRKRRIPPELVAEAMADRQRVLDLGAARALPPEYVLLTPKVPITIPEDPSDSWFGGSARLPADMPWPQIDGADALFLCQINCAGLPQDIWGGVGPRSGWLAFFARRTWPYVPLVLHFDGPCETRPGPSPEGADWFWDRRHSKPCPELPRWPIAMQATNEIEPKPRGFQKRRAPDFPDPLANEAFNLRRPEFQPLDRQTLEVLLRALRADVDRFGKFAADALQKSSDGSARAKANATFIPVRSGSALDRRCCGDRSGRLAARSARLALRSIGSRPPCPYLATRPMVAAMSLSSGKDSIPITP